MKAILKGGDECDVFSRKARRLVHMKHGTIKWIKRKFWKRQRRIARMEIRNEVRDDE